MGAVVGTAIILAGCSATPSGEATSSADGGKPSGKVVLVTHDSFYLPDELIAQFEADTGLELEFVAPGDTGLLVNQLALTKGDPLGDVAYGIDNTFASRALREDIFEPYTSPAAAPGDLTWVDEAHTMTAIDFSDVCVNADLTWFEREGLALPQSFEDLRSPAYAGLLTAPNPATSSPGMAFLLATVAAMPDGWEGFWADLAAGDVRTTSSWSDSYYTDFSAPNYGGSYPLVVSYASSPPSEVIDGVATTVALLDTCFRQVEYAGVLRGAANPEGARLVIDWLLSDEVQSALPESMYVYPVSPDASIPTDWEQFAPLSPAPWQLDPEEIDANRDVWIATWSGIVLG